MNKSIITVPRGIRYISEWGEYSLKNFNFPHILNKQLTGCGFTEYCLTCDMDIILCSPRRILLENKLDQHREDVFYFRNDFISADLLKYDTDISKSSSTNSINKSSSILDDNMSISNKVLELKRNLLGYIDHQRKNNLACKILVTYDSFKLVRELIEASSLITMEKFQVVIDEFQSIFTDSRFKSDTELKFLENLRGLSKVCFVSATPMIDKYLEMLDEFKNLPYYEFDWRTEDNSRVIKPQLDIKYSKSLVSDAMAIVNQYLNNESESSISKDGFGNLVEVKSKEVVLYFNSVKNICDVIKRCKLTPDNTNVLCAVSTSNQAEVKKAFKVSCKRLDGCIGRVPGKGEPHKMFTFCTRTVYLGADFYSTNAKTYIFSDANIDCLAVDISLDLPQILGRQRLDINPWKNRATLFYKTLRKNKVLTQEDFNKIIQDKTEDTYKLIKATTELEDDVRSTLISLYEEHTQVFHYKNNYLSVNRDIDGNAIPVFNNLVLVSEMRAFDIQQVDYKDRFSVFNSLMESSTLPIHYNLVESILSDFEHATGFPQRMEILCTCGLSGQEFDILLNNVPTDYRNYYLVLGPEKCKSFSYRRSTINEEFNRVLSNSSINIDSIIYSRFEVGKRYSFLEIKESLYNIYLENGFNATAKATDLTKYFNTKEVLLSLNVNGKIKRVAGYEILKRKEE